MLIIKILVLSISFIVVSYVKKLCFRLRVYEKESTN